MHGANLHCMFPCVSMQNMAHLNVDKFVNDAVPVEHKQKLNAVVDFGKINRDGTAKDDHLLKIAQMMDSWDGVVATALELGEPIQQGIKHTRADFASQKYVVFPEAIIIVHSNNSHPLSQTSCIAFL